MLGVVFVLTGVGAVLGLLAFLPCSRDLLVLSPLTHTLLLFAGEFETAAIGPHATTACVGSYPLAIEIARFAAIGATFVGAATIVAALSRDRIARMIARSASDVDLVVGLNPLSLPLVQALVEEADRRTEEDPRWGDSRRRARTRVVVLGDDPQDPLAAEVTAAGAVAITGNATEPAVLRPILTHWRFWRPRSLRPSVRRLFAVTDRQHVNLRVFAAATRALEGVEIPTSARVVPRLIVRMDDAREARDFRLAYVSADRGFVDAISTDDLVAADLVDELVSAGCETLIIQGDTALVTAMLDVLAWRAWSDTKIAEESGAAGSTPDPAAPDRIASRIILVGERATQVLKGWERTRPSTAAALGERGVRVQEGDWEVEVDALLDGTVTALVATEATPAARSGATRIARMHPRVRVFAFDPDSRGLESSDPAEGSRRGLVTRFGPTLHRTLLPAGGPALKVVPEDGWTRLARHLHEAYIAKNGKDGRPARLPWGDAGTAPAQRAPEFVREDNLRQLRHLLAGWPCPAGGRSWGLPDAFAEGVPDADELAELARSEHERWVRLRVENGWSGIANDPREREPSEDPLKRLRRHDEARQNANIRDWTTGIPFDAHGNRIREVPLDADKEALAGNDDNGLHAWNKDVVQRALDLLREVGIVPVREQQRFQRVGEVTARRLDEAHAWSTDHEDALRGQAGDWLVTSPDGGERTVAAVEFGMLYEPLGGDVFRRRGRASARRAQAEEQIQTLEGPATAGAGDWIVTDERCNSWPVPDAEFRASYARAASDRVS